MPNTNKRAKMLRTAAVLILIALIMNVAVYAMSIIVGEVQESLVSGDFKALFNPTDKEDFAKALANCILLPANVADLIITLLVVIMLFALKEKKAGILFIVSACVSFVLITATCLIVITSTTDADTVSNLTAYLIVTVIYQILIFLLGLLFTGAFKSKTKVAGIIIAVLFMVFALFRIVLMLLGLPDNIKELNEYIEESGWTSYDSLVAAADMFCGPIMFLFNIVGVIICSFAVALTSKKEKTEPEIS